MNKQLHTIFMTATTAKIWTILDAQVRFKKETVLFTMIIAERNLITFLADLFRFKNQKPASVLAAAQH